jgi:hypothetical protein
MFGSFLDFQERKVQRFSPHRCTIHAASLNIVYRRRSRHLSHRAGDFI